jgi:type I restriction-modification system DNA methylase subunit
VLGINTTNPESILTGRDFKNARVFGAVESDFFDWILLAPGGPELVSKIALHAGRFKWSTAEADVLKVVYESLIDRAERHGLGEYYTPDWLAAKVVRRAIDNPVEARVLDPACGSGTFLFHAVRRFLSEAEAAGMEGMLLAAEATRHIAGIDIHPVAVIIARVTYLIAPT